MGASLPFPGTCYPPLSERHWGGRRIIGSWPSVLDNLLIGLWEISGPRQIPGRHGCFPWFTMRILGTKIGFYPVLQELGLFKQLTEHCLASVSPCLQWPGSSHSPDSQNFPGNSMRWWAFQALPRFLLGLIYLRRAWKTEKRMSQHRKPCLRQIGIGHDPTGRKSWGLPLTSAPLVPHLLRLSFHQRSQRSWIPDSLLLP